MSQRLNIALRWMAGGDKFDIASNHGVHFNEVLESIWIVVDTVNSCKEFGIKFPDIHVQQEQNATDFK